VAGSIYELKAALKTAVADISGGGYTLTSARCVLGFKPLAGNAAFLKSLATDGPYMVIGPAAKTEHLAAGASRISTYDVEIDLWFGLARETADTLANVEALVEAIDEAWAAHETTWDAPEIDAQHSPAVLHYAMRCAVKAGC
jgi:hypothetical protein